MLSQTPLQPPVTSHVVDKETGRISDPWRQYFAGLQPFLERINQSGFQISPVDTATRDKLVPVHGQHIYNTDLKKTQFWNGTAWETITSA